MAGTLRDSLEASARSASAAYSDFASFLERDLLPRGRERDGVGRERYEPQSRAFLGATVDLDETYAWGWEELKRIEDDMDRVAGQIVPGGHVPEAVAALDADPRRVISGKEAFREWMQELADKTMNELADVHFDIPEPIRRIECCLAPTSDGGIYYTGPSEDWSRPGRMWWAVPEGIDTFSTWQEVTTVYHEGVPGHHLQVAQTAYRKDLLNRWQRTMCWVSGHGEGWALYAERLMDDLGYLEDPGHRLGMLDAQRLRAVRVIVDIGMHLELEIPVDNPFGFAPGVRLDGRPRASVPARALPAGRRRHRVRAPALPRLAGAGAVVQGRRADLAAGARRRAGPQGQRLRPQGVPPRRARPRLDRPRPVAAGAGPAVTTRCAAPTGRSDSDRR